MRRGVGSGGKDWIGKRGKGVWVYRMCVASAWIRGDVRRRERVLLLVWGLGWEGRVGEGGGGKRMR